MVQLYIRLLNIVDIHHSIFNFIYIYFYRRNINLFVVFFKPIQDGGGGRDQKPPPPYQFSPVTSTNIGTSPKSFLSFSLNPFAALV